jgi:hypothetical protein
MKKLLLPIIVILALSSNAALAAPENMQGKMDHKSHKKEIVAALPKEKAEMLEKAVAAQVVKSKGIDEKIKASRKELRALLAAEQFNKEAYLKKSSELAKLEADKFISRSEAIAEIAPKFTASERKAVIISFNHSGKKHHNSKKPKA